VTWSAAQIDLRKLIFPSGSGVIRKTGTMGTLASQTEIGIWVQAGVDAGGGRPSHCGDPGYAILQSSAFVVGKYTISIGHLPPCAFLNALTMGTPFPYVPAAFQQRQWRSHVFPLEMTPDLVVFRAFMTHDLCGP